MPEGKYCLLVKKQRRSCTVTTKKEEDSEECEYKNNKCYTLPIKKSNIKKKDKKTVLIINDTDTNKPHISCDYKTRITVETLEKYRSKKKNITCLDKIAEFNSNLNNLPFPPKRVADFWLDNIIEQSGAHTYKASPKQQVTQNKKISKKAIIIPPFNNLKYKLVNVPDDGNCGYHSFLKAMTLNNYKMIKNKKKVTTCDELRRIIKDKFESSKRDSEKAAALRAAGGIAYKGQIPSEFWMEDKELELLAKQFKVCIHVWDSRLSLWTFVSNKVKNNISQCLENEQNIYMYADGIHYQVIIKRE